MQEGERCCFGGSGSGWGRRTGGTQGGRPDHTRRPIGCLPLVDVPGGRGDVMPVNPFFGLGLTQGGNVAGYATALVWT